MQTANCKPKYFIQNTSPEIKASDEYKKEFKYLKELIRVCHNDLFIRVGMANWKRQHYAERHFDPSTKSFFICFDFKSIPLDAPYEQCDEDFEWPPENEKVPETNCQAGTCRNPYEGRTIVQCVALHKNVQCAKLVHENCAYIIINKNRFCSSGCCKAIHAAPPYKALVP